MAVPVMQVRIMSVTVSHRRMAMPMAVRLTRGGAGRMIMLMMAVMNMAMLMLERLVGMLMAVRFGEVQPESDGHEHSGDDKRHGDGFAKHHHGEERADKRRSREISA